MWCSVAGCTLSVVGRLTTHPNFFPPSSRIALVYQSFCFRKIADRLYYDRIVEKKLVEMLEKCRYKRSKWKREDFIT